MNKMFRIKNWNNMEVSAKEINQKKKITFQERNHHNKQEGKKKNE